MAVIRTSEELFENLPDFHFVPRYVDIIRIANSIMKPTWLMTHLGFIREIQVS